MIDLRLKPALETLHELNCAAPTQADSISRSSDADKANYEGYYECALELVGREG